MFYVKHFSFSFSKFSIVIGLALVALFCAGTGIASAGTVYVATDGSGDYNCDGADDQIQINDALDYIDTLGGGTVHLKAGTYIVEERVVVSANTTLEGDNQNDSIIKLVDWCPIRSHRIIKAGGDSITFQDFALDGNNGNQCLGERCKDNVNYGADGIVTSSPKDNLIFRRLHIHNTGKDGIVGGGDNWLVENNLLDYIGHDALRFKWLYNSLVQNNDVIKTGSHCIRYSLSSYNTIRKNLLRQINTAGGDFAIEIQQYGYNDTIGLIFEENIIQNGAHSGVSFTTGESNSSMDRNKDHIIRNNIFDKCSYRFGYSKAVIDINIPVKNVLIENNVIVEGQYHGIGTRNLGISSIGIVAKNNIITRNNGYGIYGTGITSTYNNIFDNGSGSYGNGASSGSGDIHVNPLFIEDNSGGYPDIGDFHLQAGSPCIDAGDSSSNYSNEPSPNGGRINIGAYGNTAEAATSDGSIPDDTTPPTRSNGAPSGTLSAGTTATTLSLSTNENADCKYSTSAGVSYPSMSETFSTTGATSHSTTITGLSDGNNYTYYIRCRDKSDNANANTNDYLISFSVEEAGTPPPPDQLIARYKFDETSGNTATDSSDNNNNGALTNMNTSTAWVNGKINGGLELDGVDDYVQVPDSTNLDNITQGITLMAWVKIPVGDRHSVLARWLYGTDIYERSFEFDISSNGTMNFGLSSDGTSSNANWLVSNGTITSNEWAHIAASSDGTTMKMYINGQPDPNTAISPTNGIHQGQDLHIGAWEYNEGARGSNLNGVIDEARIYNYALTASQIQQHYEDGNQQTPPTTLSINLDLQGKPILGNRELLFSVYNTGQSTPIYEKTISTDNSDNINIDLSDFTGNRYNNYDIKIEMLHYLDKKIFSHNLVDSITTPVSLKLGDINDDNVINQSDYFKMGYAWFTSDANSDLNEDGIVNSLDLSWLNRNWLESGD